MSKIKGTDVVALRVLLKEKGAAAEEAFQGLLTSELKRLYLDTMAFTWNSVDLQTRLYEAAVEILFPGDPDGLCRLGREMARRSYSTIYKILLRLPSLQFVMNQAAKMWVAYFEQGVGSIIDAGEKTATFVVSGYPELPRSMRQVVRGNITAITELTGIKNVRIRHDESDPKAWKWIVQWG